MSRKFVKQYADPKGSLIEDPLGLVVFAEGAAAPTNSQSGFAKGCIYINTAGTAGTLVYCNIGTATSTNWQNIV